MMSAALSDEVRAPFSCPSCHRLLVSIPLMNASADRLRPLDLALTSRQAAIERDREVLMPLHRDIHSFESSRGIRRLIEWATPALAVNEAQEREELLSLSDLGSASGSADDEALRRALVLTVDGILNSLVKMCPHAGELQKLAERLPPQPSGLRLSGRSPLVAAAILKTAVLLGRELWIKCTLAQRPLRGSAVERFHMWNVHRIYEWPSRLLNVRLTELEVLSLFAVVCAEIAKGEPTLQSIAWSNRPPLGQFHAAVRRDQTEAEWIARIRPRANERSVARLLERLKDRWLS
jgi:hypothetical protein